MRSNRYITKGISVFLIVVLMQKAGGGLLLHNWLHAQNPTHVSSDHLPGVGLSNSTCTCIDDFYIPFTETPEQVVQPTLAIRIEFIASLQCLIPVSSKFFHSLRGPPARMV